MKIVFMIAASLAACLVCLDAFPGPHGGGGGGRGGPRGGDGGPRERPKGGRPRFNGTYYIFKKTVDANTTVNQTGFILNGTKIVIISTNSKNFNESKIINNFNESNSFKLLIPKRLDICFVLTIPEAFEASKAELERINNTQVEAGETTELTASQTPLTAEELTKFKNVSYACGRKPIVLVTPTDANAAPSTNATSQITVLDVSKIYRITYFNPPARTNFIGGPAGGRPAPPPNRKSGGGPTRRGNFGGRH